MINWTRSPALPRGFSRDARLYLRPLGLLSGTVAEAAIEAGTGRRLAGGRFAFTACEVLLRAADTITSTVAPLAALLDWSDGRAAVALDRLSAPRPPLLGLPGDRPLIMGVINVTPDSFSDGGDFANTDGAIARGHALIVAGADILDIGGESTRPGSDPVTAEQELARVLPVIAGLADEATPLSIDSRRAAVMRRALAAGAGMLNDVSAMSYDPESLSVAAASDAPVALMHARGDPKTMQRDPVYDFAPLDIYDDLADRIAACEAAGIARRRIVVDPGIGFGKTVAHNIELLQYLSLFHGLGCRLLLGVSRKSFIARLAGAGEAKGRVPGSLAAGLAGLDQGVQMLRVHDVAETAQAVAIWRVMSGEAPRA